MTQTATAGLPLDGANVAGFLSNAGTAVNAVKNVVDGVNAIAGGAGPNGIGGVGALGGLGNAHTLMEAGRHMLNPGNLAATTAGLAPQRSAALIPLCRDSAGRRQAWEQADSARWRWVQVVLVVAVVALAARPALGTLLAGI